MTEFTHALMHPAPVPVKRPARTTILRTVGAALGAALVLAGAAVPANASGSPEPQTMTAAAAASEAKRGIMLKAGPILRNKYGFKTEWLGPIETGGRLGDCYQYGRLGPDGNDWRIGQIADVKDPGKRAQVQWLANKYWDAGLKSATISAARKATVNRVLSDEFRRDWKSSYVNQLNGTPVVALSDRMLAEAKRNAGPVALKVTFDSKPTPGVTGSATAAATGNGKSYAGQELAWTVTNAKVASASKRTNDSGKGSVRFVPDGVGKVRVTAVLTSPEWRRARYSIPSTDRRQHLVRSADKNTIEMKALAEYDTKFGATVTQECGSECKGRPPVTFAAEAGLNPVQWQAVVNGKAVATLNLTAKSAGSKTFTGTDGTTVTLRYRVKVAGQWSGWRTSQTFDVVCPAWPGIEPVMACECDGNVTGGYKFTGPGGKWYIVVRVTRGATVEEKSITGTETATLTGPIASGDHVFAEFTAYADAAHTKRVGGGKWRGYTSD